MITAPSRLVLIACFIASLSSCAVMNEDECKNANWYAIGYQDGSQGSSANAASERGSACAEYNVQLNFNDYQRGYQQGLNQFCRASSGFYAGSNGYQYQGICPASLEKNFLSGYRQGQQLYQAKQKVNRAQQKYDDAKIEQDNQQQRLNNLKQQLIYDDLTPMQRQQILNKIEQLNDNKHDLSQLRRQLDRARYQLRMLKQSLDMTQR